MLFVPILQLEFINILLQIEFAPCTFCFSPSFYKLYNICQHLLLIWFLLCLREECEVALKREHLHDISPEIESDDSRLKEQLQLLSEVFCKAAESDVPREVQSDFKPCLLFPVAISGFPFSICWISLICFVCF